MSFPDDFAPVDWDAPLDVDAVVAGVPAGATLKGMFFNECVKAAVANGAPKAEQPHYTLFKDYPQVEFIQLLVKTARAVYPDLSLRRAIGQFGETAYPTIAATTIGRLIFGAFGNDIRRIFGVARRGYRVSMSEVKADTLSDGPHFSHLRLTNIYIFPDAYQVGVMNGAMKACGEIGESRFKWIDERTIEIFCCW